MVSREKEHWAVTTMEGVKQHVESYGSEDIIENDMLWGTEEKFVKDEVVMDVGEEVDGWPRIGKGHCWIKVSAAAEWGETEKRELQEAMDAYVNFSLKTGSRAKGEIFVRHTEWEGALVDVRESNHESPRLVVARWRSRGNNKTLGER